MTKYGRGAGAVIVVIAVAVAWRWIGRHGVTVENVRAHRESLLLFVDRHYLAAVLLFIGLYLTTALIVPGALVLTVTGGMLFGTVPALLYVNIGATAGSLLAFFLARFFIGRMIQERFGPQLARFNGELALHGRNYLLTLRILPVVPFFVVNYGAGLTRIPLRTFAWTTSVGMLPGSFIYTFTGHQLRHVERGSDLVSGRIVGALVLLAAGALLPVLHHHLCRLRKRQ